MRIISTDLRIGYEVSQKNKVYDNADPFDTIQKNKILNQN